MFSKLVQQCSGSDTIIYKEKEISFKAPFQRFTMSEALEKFAGVKTMERTELCRALDSASITYEENFSDGQLMNLLYDKFGYDRVEK